MEITFLDATHGARPTDARLADGTVLVTPEELVRLTGWSRKPEGLCRDDVCVPVRDDRLDRDGALDLVRVADALGRPVVVDAAAGVVALGDRSAERRGPIESGRAPDFTLARLDGSGDFRFADVGRRKKLLLAWSSW